MASDLGLLKMSFYITYVLLLTTTTITFIEALRTNIPSVRHVLNIETCISIVAAFFYAQFLTYLDKNTLDYNTINRTRYTDWFITTPLMLLGLCLVLTYNNKSSVHIGTYALLVLLNFSMLWFGYIGEYGKISKATACLLGFIPFIIMFGIIWFLYVQNSSVVFNYILFTIYVVIWAIYGFVYLMNEKTKNISYNVLDALAKCIVGLSIWAYFTGTLVI